MNFDKQQRRISIFCDGDASRLSLTRPEEPSQAGEGEAAAAAPDWPERHPLLLLLFLLERQARRPGAATERGEERVPSTGRRGEGAEALPLRRPAAATADEE